MADNFLERHYDEYLIKKSEWEKRKKHLKKGVVTPKKQDDKTTNDERDTLSPSTTTREG